MPWTGSAPNQQYTRSTGSQTGANAWAQEKAAGTDVEAEVFDVHDQDIATALNLALKKDGGNTASANIPMGGFKLTGVADAAARDQFAAAGQLADGEFDVYGNTSGTDTYTLADNGYVDSAYRNGMIVKARFVAANTGAATLNINSIGAADIKTTSGAAIAAGHIAATSIHMLQYNSTSGDFHLMSPSALAVESTRTLTAGAGISGGGTLAADRSFALDTSELSTESTIDPEDDTLAFYDDSASADVRNTLRKVVGTVAAPAFILRDTDAADTAAPTAAVNAWTKKTFDGSAWFDDGHGGLVSLSSSAFTLSAGIWVIKAMQPIDNTGWLKLRIRNTSDGSTEGVSIATGASNVARGNVVHVTTKPFTIASNKTFELQYYTTVAGTLGQKSNATQGELEVWTVLEGYKYG